MNITRMDSETLIQAIELSDRTFRKPGQPSMGSSFPLIFYPGISHSFGAFNNEGSIASFMGLVPFTIRSEAARLKVMSIGSVCTDPESRGQGLAGELLQQCKDHANRAGVSLLFISGDRSLYTRAGCRHFGSSMEYRLTAEAASRLTASLSQESANIHIREMQAEDLYRVHELVENRTASYVSSVSEFERLLGASAYSNVLRLDQKILVAEDRNGIVASAIIGVPGTAMETPNPATMVDWVGQPEAGALLLAEAVNRYHLEVLSISLPWQDREIAKHLTASGIEHKKAKNAGTIYLVNGRELLRQIAPLIPEEAAGILQAEGDHGPYRYQKGEETIMLDDDGLLSLLFDPESPYASADESTPIQRLSAVPLPFIYGLQYV